MTKKEARALQEQNGMEIVRNEITHEAIGLQLKSEKPVAELETIMKADPETILPCVASDYSVPGIMYDYRIFCPSAWFDLYGWTDSESNS